MKITLLIVFLAILCSCKKKFNHENITINYPCDYCSFADSIVGNYEGRYIQIEFNGYLGTNPQIDTIIDTIVQIKIDKSPNEDNITDSLVSKFNLYGYINYDIFISGIEHNISHDGIFYNWMIYFEGLPYSMKRIGDDGSFNLLTRGKYLGLDNKYVYYNKLHFDGQKL